MCLAAYSLCVYVCMTIESANVSMYDSTACMSVGMFVSRQVERVETLEKVEYL